MNNDKSKANIGLSISLFIIAIILIGFSISRQFKLDKREEELSKQISEKVIEKIILQQPKCENTFDEYQKLKQQKNTVTLIDDPLNTYGNVAGEFANLKSVTIKRSGAKSLVACGYLYVRAHTSRGPLAEWENVYINPLQFGGHLVHNQRTIINRDVGMASETLFPLEEIHYLTPEVREPRVANWVALLNVTNRFSFDISLNTRDTAGIIEEITITYKCWNPETGKETNDCQLSK